MVYGAVPMYGECHVFIGKWQRDSRNSNPTGSLLVLLPLLTLTMFLVTITLLMTTVLGQEEQDGEQQQWLTYESHFGYSIQYPSDWEALEERNYSYSS